MTILVRLIPFLLGTAVSAQQLSSRYIEVVVTDSVQLKLQGIDYTVSMPNPFDAATIDMSAGAEEEADFGRLLNEAEKKARDKEKKFLEVMKSGGFTYRISSTTHAEDYAFGSDRKMDVNTYLVELRDTAKMRSYHDATEGMEFNSNVERMHFTDPAVANARLMKKLYEQAQAKARALAAASGEKLGSMMSAEEMRESEGSIFQQIIKMERGRRSEGPDIEEGSVQRSSMAFRFELLAK